MLAHAVSCCFVQNPDPKAHAYFASYITKAYAALTDEVSRQNYEKYGHPDGHQVRSLLGTFAVDWLGLAGWQAAAHARLL